MFAVIKSGGKQYRVQAGDTIRVEKIAATEGGEVNLDEVLMVAEGDDISLGEPVVKGASVSAVVKAHGRGAKIKVVKFKRRKHHHKQQGHRQAYTELEITAINRQ